MSYEVSIFGGGGFVGKSLTSSLLSSDYKVTVVDNYSVTPSPKMALPDSLSGGSTINRVIEDVCTPKEKLGWEKMFGHLAEGVHTLVWLPAVQGYTRTIDEFGDQNVYPIFNLFEAIRHYKAQDRIRRIVLASSQAVYGPGKELSEDASEAAPISVYGVSKLAQEHVMNNLARLFGITVYSMRYSVILGKGQSADSLESGVLRNWTRSFKMGRGPEVYGDGLQLRDFVHIDDVTDANVRAIESDKFENDIFNVAGFSCSVIDLAYIFQEVSSGAEPCILGECPREDGGVHDFTSSGRHAYEVLGYEPKKDLHAQVTDSFNHFRMST